MLEFGNRQTSTNRAGNGGDCPRSCWAPSRWSWPPRAGAFSTRRGRSAWSAVVAPGPDGAGVILFMGAVSGAHLNPAVSLAFALRGDFPWKRVPATSSSSSSARRWPACSSAWCSGIRASGGGAAGPGYKHWQALLMEIVLTALLVSVILGTASAAQNVGVIAAFGVGGYIALAGCGRPRSAALDEPGPLLRSCSGQRDWKATGVCRRAGRRGAARRRLRAGCCAAAVVTSSRGRQAPARRTRVPGRQKPGWRRISKQGRSSPRASLTPMRSERAHDPLNARRGTERAARQTRRSAAAPDR